MIFYYAPKTVSFATHIALEEANAEYEPRRLNFLETEQRSEEYLKINPKGRVPALVTDRGIITETPALLTYIAQAYPAAKLAPLDDPFEFAKLQEFNCYLCSTVHVAHAHKMRGSRWVEDDDNAAKEAMTAKVPQTMTECFTLIENEMFVGPWVLGEEYSISDIYLFTISRWLASDKVDINNFPKVVEHSRRVAARAAVQKLSHIYDY